MIIDCHTHIYDEKVYKEYFEKAKGRVKKALVMYSSTTQDEKGRILPVDLNKLIDFAQKKGNLFVIGSVEFDKNISHQLRTLEKLFKQKKIFGIKLYPGYEHFFPSDEKIYPIAKLCQKYGKPLTIHTGDVYNFEKKAILKYSHPIHVDDLATRFKKCKIVIAHFGFPHFLEAANIAGKNENVFVDVSATITEMGSKKENAALFNQYLVDLRRVYSYYSYVRRKTMFGTDFAGSHTYLNKVGEYIKLVEKAFIKKEQPLVFYQLAETLFFS